MHVRRIASVAIILAALPAVAAFAGDRGHDRHHAADADHCVLPGIRHGASVSVRDGQWRVGFSLHSGRYGLIHDRRRHRGHGGHRPHRRHHRPPHDFYHHPVRRDRGGVVVIRGGERISTLPGHPVVIRSRYRTRAVPDREPVREAADPAAGPWGRLADGDAEGALAAFARAAVDDPGDGLARAGYALAALDAGNGRRAAWAMRRALAADPTALLYAPVDGKLGTRIEHRLRVIDTETGERDAMLLSAALHAMRHEAEAAMAALRRLRDLGGEDEKTLRALAEMIAATN